VRVDVVSDLEADVPDLGEDHAARDAAEGVGVVAGHGVVVLGEARRAVLDQIEVFVDVGRRLANGDANVAERRVCEHEPQVAVGLRQIDVVAGLEPDVIGDRREARNVEAREERAA
jgi:hypothetical protein